MRFLRQNTAVRITVGPFFDKTDGVTPEVGITVTSCKLTMMVDDDDNTAANLIIDAAPSASGGSNDMVHVTNDDAGFYDLELTAAQTNYVGRAMIAITDAATHCPVFHEFMIVPANVYDSLFGTDKLQVDAVEISSDSTAADNCEADYDGTGYAGGTIVKKADTTKILGTALTETSAGYLAAGFKKLLDVASPVFTLASVNQSADNDTKITAIKAKTDMQPSVWYSP